MKTNDDVLKQILNKLSSIEARLQILEMQDRIPPAINNVVIGQGCDFPDDYCHKEFMNKTYPDNLTCVYCDCDKCSNVRQPKER